MPKVKLEVVVDTADADKVADTIMRSAATGQIGDGKVWTVDLGSMVRIRTGEKGNDAL